jgi:hypothetical protein
MRCVENHDQMRIQQRMGDQDKAMAWIAFAAFNKGPFFIYSGQESADMNRPSLFDIDKINWGTYELAELHAKLAALKKDLAQVKGKLTFLAAQPCIQAVWEHGAESLYGIFNVTRCRGQIDVQLPDGTYEDLVDGDKFIIKEGQCCAPESVYIVRYALDASPKEFTTVLMDSHVE